MVSPVAMRENPGKTLTFPFDLKKITASFVGCNGRMNGAMSPHSFSSVSSLVFEFDIMSQSLRQGSALRGLPSSISKDAGASTTIQVPSGD